MQVLFWWKRDFITDNLSKDWTVLDENGREIDSDLNPILYYKGVNNYLNNFNKISGKEDMESIVSSDRSTRCELIIYDKYKYDKGNVGNNSVVLDNSEGKSNGEYIQNLTEPYQ